MHTHTLANIQEMPPPYPMSQHAPTSSDVKKEEAGYPQQAAACYPTGLGPTQSGFPQQGYPAQVAYNPQQGYPPQSYPQVSVKSMHAYAKLIAVHGHCMGCIFTTISDSMLS